MKILRSAVRVYSALLVIALIWVYFQDRLSWSLFWPLEIEALVLQGAAGLATALFMILLSIYASKNFLWAQMLEDEVSKILVPLQVWEIGAIAILSGVAEEVFFRGAFQPVFGLVPASLLFGLAHLVPRKEFLPWSFYAVFAGFLLGSVFELTRSLLPVVLAHTLVNFVLIVILNRRHYMQPA
ncbi:MAG: CPBP family intramembrane glutamic endopeptidase [Acidobacteriota bacterium]